MLLDFDKERTFEVSITVELFTNQLAQHNGFDIWDILDMFMALQHGDELFLSQIRQWADRWDKELQEDA